MKDSKSRKKGKVNAVSSDTKYIQHMERLKASVGGESQSRMHAKIVFMFTSVAVVLLAYGVTCAHWILPLFYAASAPVLFSIRTICYWRYKWQYFILDFCYFANALAYISLWFPNEEKLSLVVFAVANGPVLVAAAVYGNSLAYHHHDKVISCYLHFLPAFLTFCKRWFPETTSRFWMKSFLTETPAFDVIWLYAVPFAFFFLHSALYCLIVNVVMRPKDPYVTSYSYLAEKYASLNCLGGPWGQCVVFYGLSWLFCLASLVPAVLAYDNFTMHCALLVLVYLVVLWNGASYYIDEFSQNGFNTMKQT